MTNTTPKPRLYGLTGLMSEHVSSLAGQNFLRVSWVDREDECDAWTDEGQDFVKLVRIQDRGSYICDLHQIGHHLSDGSRNLYVDEVLAWRWAFTNSRVEVTDIALEPMRASIRMLVTDINRARAFISTLEDDAMKSNAEQDRP